jgi:pimeloyl-ACP methyl ester carboxylesterase
VLVGWFGCKPSHLRKYAKMYLSDALGYDAVVCVTPPVAATLFPALGDAFAATALGAVAHARKILAEEDAEGKSASSSVSAPSHQASAPVALGPACALDERPLILHLFSNGGYVFAGNIMHAQTGFVADTETPLGASITTVLRRRLGFAPEPAAAARFSDSVAALVMDSAPGELEPGMVAASFRSVLTGSRASVAPDENTPFASENAFASVAAAALAWRPIAKRLRYVDAAWGGFAAVTGNGWSGDCKSRPGNAAEVAHAVAEKKLRRLKAEAQQMRDEQTRGDARGERRDAVAAARPARASPGTTIENGGLLKCPSLFLYSAADALIPPEGVEAFAAARARRLGTVSSASTEGAGAGGGRVVLRRWESAAHCEIGKDHPEAYAAALRAFLGRAPDDGNSDGSSAASPESGSGAVNNIKPFVRPVVDRRPAAARDADAAVAETTER